MTPAAPGGAAPASAPARGGAPLAPLVRLPRDGPLPASFSQERLWFLDRLDPGRATYNLPALFFRLKGDLKQGVLQAALDELVRRHESLRTTFQEVDGRPLQAIGPPRPLPLPAVDLRALPGVAAREAAASALLTAEAEGPFDLLRGPLTRALLVRVADGDHLFLLTQHHIVSDGWSLGLLQRDLAVLYAAAAEGRPPRLPGIEAQPADFAAWQRRRLEEGELAPLVDWWKRRLGGSLPLLELPADHPRPAVHRFRGVDVHFDLAREVSGAVWALGRRERATPFMVLFAAFVALLHRISGQTDLLVGFPVASRPRRELEATVGFFVNTLVLRVDAADDPPFQELLRRVRNEAFEALARQDLPFERLVDELQPERALSHSPLVQVLFSFSAGQSAALQLPGLELTSPKAGDDSGTAKFDLMLALIDQGPEGLTGGFEVNRDLFEPATVHRLIGHFQRLLAGALARPEVRLSDLPLLADAERHQALVEWNDTRRAGSGDGAGEMGGIGALFAARAREAPEATALVCGSESVTYGELAARAGRLAGRLRELGVGPDVRVGVCMERSPGLIAALLGIVAAGGAYVPLDPAQPQERRLAMLRESGARALLADAPLAGDWEGFEGPVLVPAAGGPGDGHVGSDLVLVDGLTPDHLAYVIFTSGSTGRPKGVAVPHRGVVRLVRGAGYVDAGYADLGREQVFLQLSPISFDAATFEIWGPLLNGGRLVIFPPGPPSPAELGAVVREERVTTLWLTAGLFHALAEEGLEGLDGLAQLLAGGDVLSPAHVRRALAALPGLRLIDGYGPTESTTFACCHGMTAADAPAGPVPIGRPIGDTRAHVVDRRGRPVAIGVAGELLLGGDGLARGYEADARLTAERFAPDPFAAGPGGGRLYRTGDRARWRPDGRLEFLGRTDEQVKIRGFRVEPGEIETALAEHPRVAEAAVVATTAIPAIPASPGSPTGPAISEARERRLAAFLVARPGEPRPAAREVRVWLQERLPPYLVPASVLWVEELPLTPHGKVDRRVLAELAGRGEGAGSAEPRPGLVPPRTDLERRLAEIWAGLLRLAAVGVHDNFFDLGGDSLLAIQMVSRAGRAGIALTLRQLFGHQTVAELAAALEAAPGAPAVGAEQGWVTGPVPMTPGQVWFFDRVAQHLRAPHQFSTRALCEIRAPGPPVEGAVLAGRVARAVAAILFQHDALRLRFAPRGDHGDRWEQWNAGPEALADSWSQVDLDTLPEAAQDGAIEGTVRQLLARSELQGPLARFVLFGLGSARPPRMLAMLHHLVSDAASWRILREDLDTVCGQALRGEAVALPPKTTSFRAWALRQAELARSPELRGQVDLWLGMARAGGHTLPADFPAGDGGRGGGAGSGEVAKVAVGLDEEETRRLLHESPGRVPGKPTGTPGAGRTRLANLVLAAVTRAFARWTGSGSLLLRVTLHGRDPVFDDVDLSRTMGWISTTAPVLLDLAGTESPAEARAAVAAQIARVPLRGLGYGLLRYMSGDPDIEARMATVVAGPAATFNFLGRFGAGIDERDAGSRDEKPRSALAEIPFSVELKSSIPRRDPQLRIGAGILGDPPRFFFSWEYGRDFYRHATIERLAESCLEELRRLVAAG